MSTTSARTPTASTPSASTDRLTQTVIDVPRGLAGVIVAETTLGDVRGLEGFYHYRQYSAVELARQRSFEDVWHLMYLGHLPDAVEAERFAARVRAARRLPPRLIATLPAVATATADGDPLAGLRCALSLLAGELGFRPSYDLDPETRLEQAITISAVTPVLLAGLHRLRQGRPVLESDTELDHSANYLHLLTGQTPTPEALRAITSYLISTIDHGSNASTFAARVIASTGADLASCVVGALGALSGPLHGGAPSRALDTVDAIGSPDRIEPWVRAAIRSGDRIMGFGHPIYRTEDPRSRMLKEIARGFGGPRVELAVAVEEGVLRILEEEKPGRGLHTNVEFYAGLVMELCDIPRSMFTPTFAVGRMIGWTAQILEQAMDSKIIRPSMRYVGPLPPEPVPARPGVTT